MERDSCPTSPTRAFELKSNERIRNIVLAQVSEFEGKELEGRKNPEADLALQWSVWAKLTVLGMKVLGFVLKRSDGAVPLATDLSQYFPRTKLCF